MKKIYIAPQMMVVKTKLTSIIAVSDPLANVDKSNDGVAPGSFESRQDNGWDIWNEDYDEYDEY